MIGWMTLLVGLAGLLLPGPGAAKPLDPLLEGFDDACRYTEALSSLLQSSYAFARREGTLAIPAGYETVFGTATVRPQDEYLQITLPVKDGTWRDVPVTAIEVYITALASGFTYHAVLFEKNALKAAETAFSARGIAAKTKLTAEDDGGFGWDTGFAVIDGAPRYQCDLST